ncbi:MAG: M1 family metallopeptidase [Solirubrobacteraceae bacterium]
MKIGLIYQFFLLLSLPLFSQINYYQQEVTYTIAVDVDINNFSYKGHQQINYKNNSTDTLKKFYLHLYWNAFQPSSAMANRIAALGEKADKRMFSNGISKFKDLTETQIGKHEIEFIKKENKQLNYKIIGTIIEVILDEPILPNTNASFELKWNTKIPDMIRRGGKNNKENIALTMTQWYPKVCAYDYDGWHTNEYIGREFYAPFAKFNVKITLDKAYKIGGSGFLKNSEEIEKITRLNDSSIKKINWNFEAENIHDFAWAADKEFITEKEQLINGPLIYYVFKNNSSIKKNIELIKPYISKYFNLMEKYFGKYPYKQYSFVQGGDGGMEYGMCSILLMESKNIKGLLGLMVHEATHSWFQQVLGTNESERAWLDEGFTSFVESYMMQLLIPESNLPNPNFYAIQNYTSIAGTENEEIMNLIADYYSSGLSYGVASYTKGEVYLAQLSYIIGEKTLIDSIKEYYTNWKFKHPTQRDFEHIIQKKSGLNLRAFFNYFTNTTYFIDYGIKSVQEFNGKTIVILKNNGRISMPIELFLIDIHNKKEIHYIPQQTMLGVKPNETNLERTIHASWDWTSKEYKLIINKPLKEINSLTIDETKRLADINLIDNIYNN